MAPFFILRQWRAGVQCTTLSEDPRKRKENFKMTNEEKARVKEYIEEERRKTETAERRTKYTIKKNLQKTRDELYCIQQALEDCICERKTTLTIMNNLLLYTKGAIENLKENDLWEGGMHW